jgi:perosamine synthetase
MKSQIKKSCLSHNSSIRQAMKAINRGALGIALLVDQETEKFIGLVTDGDIRRALLNGHGLESPVLNLAQNESITANINLPTHKVAALFNEKVRVIPLLDDDSKIVNLAIFDKRVNLPVAEPSLDEKELLYVTECILSGWISSAGRYVKKFEKIFAKFCGTKHAISTSSGTTALHLALMASDIGPGDEVILPSLTFIATANAVTYTGATPVFADSESEYWNLNPADIERLISKKSKAIIPVHLYGHPVDMDPIMEISKKYGLLVIEDAAEAHGGEYKGLKVGSIGDLGIFSFYGNKIITTGEGGMITTDNDFFADKIRMLRNHGMDNKHRYVHPMLGYNYRMTNIQAAVGVAQMEKIDAIVKKKLWIAENYNRYLEQVKGVTLPNLAKWAKSVFWLYSIRIDEALFGMSRDELMRKMKVNGIETRPVFPPVHKQPIYATGQVLPIAELIASQGLSLPSSFNLQKNDIERIAFSIDRHL